MIRLNYPIIEEVRLNVQSGTWQGSSLKFSIGCLAYATTYRKIDETIGKIWDFLINLSSESLSEQTSKRNLSLVHIAVIVEDVDAINLLLDKKLSPSCLDYLGWTPLHHAALLGNKVIVELLLERGADPYIKNRCGGTYKDIERLIHPKAIDPTSLIPLLWKKESGLKEQLTYERFKELTSSDFITENRIASNDLLLKWASPDSIKTELMQKDIPYQGITEKYLKFLEKTEPLTCLARVTHDSIGKRFSFSPGLGVFCNEEILKGGVIGEYLGDLSSNQQVSQEYVLEEIDGTYCRNEIAMCNDGWVNAFLFDMKNVEGLEERLILIATEDIKEGEQICWNYGPFHKVKLGPYLEIRRAELRAFTTNTSLIAEAWNLFLNEEKNSFDKIILIEKIVYLICTPSVMFSLLFEDAIEEFYAESILKTSMNKVFSDKWYEETPLSHLFTIATGSKKLYFLLKKEVALEFVELYKNFIMELPAKTSIINVLHLTSAINGLIRELLKRDELPLKQLTDTVEGDLLSNKIWDELYETHIKEYLNTNSQ